MQWGANYILGAFKLEFDFTKGTQGLSMPGLEQYERLRLIGLMVTFILVVIGFTHLLIKRRRLAFLLGGLVAGAAAAPMVYYFVPGMQFLTRLFEYPAIYFSLVFGFGIQLLLKNYNSNNDIGIRRQKVLQPIQFAIILLITALIVAGSTFTVLTTRQSDIKMRPTYSFILGYQFMLSRSSEMILSPYPFPVQNREEQVWHFRHEWAYEEMMSEKEKAEKRIRSFSGLIGISEQWRIQQQYLELRKNTYLSELEDWLRQSSQAQFVYDNGNFKTYKKEQLLETDTVITN
jgi:hypothetical protein